MLGYKTSLNTDLKITPVNAAVKSDTYLFEIFTCDS